MMQKRASEVQVGDVVEVVGYVVEVARVERESARRMLIGWKSQRSPEGRSIVAGNAKVARNELLPLH